MNYDFKLKIENQWNIIVDGLLLRAKRIMGVVFKTKRFRGGRDMIVVSGNRDLKQIQKWEKANSNLKQKATMNRNVYCPGALITNRSL
jgi:hypothetical protein